MVGSHWRTSYKARAAVIGVTAVGLGLYAVVGGGGKSVAAPFTGKNVAVHTADTYSAAVTSDASGNVDALAMGPSHSMYFYWQVGGTWHGPLQVAGAGAAFSGPSIAPEISGNLDAAWEGPSHTLYFDWQIGGVWQGPIQMPGGSGVVYSKPITIIDSLGHPVIVAQGPSSSIYQWWVIGGTAYGPVQVAGAGSAWSSLNAGAGSASCNSGSDRNHYVGIEAEGTNHQAIHYFFNTVTGPDDPNADGCDPAGAEATSISGQNQQYSASSGFLAGKFFVDGYQGPSNSNVYQISPIQGGTNEYCVLAGAGTTYSATGLGISTNTVGSTTTAYVNIGELGPANSLYVFWFDVNENQGSNCPTFYGPLGLGGANSSFSVPGVTTDFTSSGLVTNLLVEGPSHTLWLYWSAGGSWNGPLQVGPPGSAYDSAT